MITMDELLKKANLTYEDLNAAEKETLFGMMEALQTNQLTTDKIRQAIAAMKTSVEIELANEPEVIWVFIFRVSNPKNILLKARLRNYILLEAMLTSQEKAKQAIEMALQNVNARGGV